MILDSCGLWTKEEGVEEDIKGAGGVVESTTGGDDTSECDKDEGCWDKFLSLEEPLVTLWGIGTSKCGGKGGKTEIDWGAIDGVEHRLEEGDTSEEGNVEHKWVFVGLVILEDALVTLLGLGTSNCGGRGPKTKLIEKQ